MDAPTKISTLVKNMLNWFYQLHPVTRAIIGFITVILLGGFLLWQPISTPGPEHLSFTDAIFTATSAVCVTGLIVVDTNEDLSHFGQLVVLLLIQIGGLGIILASAFLILGLRHTISLKYRRSVQQNFINWPIKKVKKALFRAFLVIFAIEVIGAGLLTYAFSEKHDFFTALWHGVFHSISAVCNAGFSLNSDSLIQWADNPLVIVTVGLLIIAGGIGFLVLAEIFSYNKVSQKLSIHTKTMLAGSGILIVTGFIAFMILEPNWTYLDYLFQSITPRTAGFNSIDLSKWSSASHLILMVFMFIGAGAGSTAGGIKITTAWVVIANMISRIRYHRHTHIFKRRLHWKQINHALVLLFIGIMIIFIITFTLTITENAGFKEILFEVFSALGTVGLSLGITSELSFLGRWIVIITMFLGRLGPLTFALIIISPNQECYTYPEEKVLIG